MSDSPLKVVQVGAGGMGRAWLATIAANPDVQLVGLVDLATETASAAAAEHGFASVPVARSVDELLAAGVDADAVSVDRSTRPTSCTSGLAAMVASQARPMPPAPTWTTLNGASLIVLTGRLGRRRCGPRSARCSRDR